MDQELRAFKRDFVRELTDQPLEPDDPRYVPLHQDPRLEAGDPVAVLYDTIDFAVGGVTQLFSGFRGSGKSTEFLRLKQRLQDSDYVVALIDVERYLQSSDVVDVPDFLLTVAGGLSDDLEQQLGVDCTKESYWERFRHFVTSTKAEGAEASAGLDLGGQPQDQPEERSELPPRTEDGPGRSPRGLR